MPTPSVSTTQYAGEIGMIIREYDLEQNENNFIGLELCPPMEVPKQEGNVPMIPIEQLLQERDDLRSNKGYYPEGDFEWGAGISYATIDRGFQMPVSDRLRRMYAYLFDAQVETGIITRFVVRHNHEKRVSALATATSNSAASAAVWSNHASATPVTDVLNARLAFRARKGIKPNVMAMSWKARQHVVHSTEIVDRLKYQGFNDVRPDMVTNQMLAGVFEVERVLVGDVMKNNANPAQTASLADVWDPTEVYLARRSTQQRVLDFQWARTLHWGEDGSQIGGVFETFYHDFTRSEYVRHRMDVIEKVIDADLIQKITGVLS